MLWLGAGQCIVTALALLGCAAAVSLLPQRRSITHDALGAAGVLLAGLVLLGLLGFAQFWVSFFGVGSGEAFRALIAVGLGAAIVFALQRGTLFGELLAIVAATAAASLLLILVAFDGHAADDPLYVAATRFTHVLPSDNRVPLDFARAILAAEIPSPLHGDWLSSDRPPLQTGLFLLLRLPGGALDWTYQAAGTSLQMLALASAYALLRLFGVSVRLALLGVGALFATPLVLINGTFVWPKLLAAAFTLVPFCLFFTPAYETTRGRLAAGALAGAGGALGMLSHGATAFALLGFSAAALVLWRLPSLRYLIGGAAAFIVLMAPWSAYQRLYDPPGDRLLKWHLAGVESVDERSLSDALTDAYGGLSIEGWAQGRAENLGKIFEWRGDAFVDAAASLPQPKVYERQDTIKSAIGLMFFFASIATGVFGIAVYFVWALAAAPAFRPATIAVGAGLALWALLMFPPASTVLHHGAYFFPIGVFLVAYAFLAQRWPMFAAGFAMAHAAAFLALFAGV